MTADRHDADRMDPATRELCEAVLERVPALRLTDSDAKLAGHLFELEDAAGQVLIKIEDQRGDPREAQIFVSVAIAETEELRRSPMPLVDLVEILFPGGHRVPERIAAELLPEQLGRLVPGFAARLRLAAGFGESDSDEAKNRAVERAWRLALKRLGKQPIDEFLEELEG